MTALFEDWTWPDGELACERCGSVNCYRVKSGKPLPYRCRDCRRHFSLKTGTLIEASKLPLRVWGWAIYREMTSLKGVSSMKLHRDLGISQKAAWFLLHRIRAAFADVRMSFDGPVGKTAVVAAKDRRTKNVVARVIDRTGRRDATGVRGRSCDA